MGSPLLAQINHTLLPDANFSTPYLWSETPPVNLTAPPYLAHGVQVLRVGDLLHARRDPACGALHGQRFAIPQRQNVEHAEQVYSLLPVVRPIFDNPACVPLRPQRAQAVLRRGAASHQAHTL